MKVGDMCNREVVYIDRAEGVIAAAKVMRERHVGDLVVVDGSVDARAPIGLLTDRDLVVSALAQDAADLTRLLVGDLLTRAVVSVSEDAAVAEALRLMRVHGVRRLPVLDARGGLVGLVTSDDVIEFLAEQLSDLALISTSQRRREEKLRP
jgi:CBS domain-containing protein